MRLVIVCEGETEQRFCRDLLSGFLGMEIDAPKIKRSNGGLVPWDILSTQLATLLKKENAVVSTLIDFYGIKKQHKFPGWEEIISSDKQKRVEDLEERMRNYFPDALRYRFIPYLQLQEFESLLFSNKEVLLNFVSSKGGDVKALEKLFSSSIPPELINGSQETSPSHRLQSAILGYQKVVHGIKLAKEIGITNMREKCPHFNQWLTTLQDRLTNDSSQL